MKELSKTYAGKILHGIFPAYVLQLVVEQIEIHHFTAQNLMIWLRSSSLNVENHQKSCLKNSFKIWLRSGIRLYLAGVKALLRLY